MRVRTNEKCYILTFAKVATAKMFIWPTDDDTDTNTHYGGKLFTRKIQKKSKLFKYKTIITRSMHFDRTRHTKQ